MQSCLKNGPTPASFCLFSFFSKQIYRKIVDFSGIRTQIVGVEGKSADHVTITTALCEAVFVWKQNIVWNMYL